MSIPVPAEELGEAVARYGHTPYLLTVNDYGRPHATQVAVSVDGATVTCSIGRRTVRNGTARPNVSLLWPPVEAGDYSLIADGDLAIDSSDDDGGVASITVTKAVLHRSAPAPGRLGAGQDEE